ncbi:MAG: hypothetical protein ACKODX_03880 [Gemmata sp.]
MSGRPNLRSALFGLLAAALAAPAAAQGSRTAAPMARAKATVGFSGNDASLRWGAEPTVPAPVPPELPVPTVVRSEPASPARPPAVIRTGFDPVGAAPVRQVVAMAGGCGPYRAPAPPRAFAAPPNQLFTCGDSSCVQVVVATADAPTPVPARAPCPLPGSEPSPLLGTWYREAPGMVIAATFTRDELKLCVTQRVDGSAATLTATAHYTLTKDGLVYGAVTGTEVGLKREPKAGASRLAGEVADLAAAAQAFVDAPLSFRTKMTSAGLMVSGLKCGERLAKDEAALLCGMFTCARDGRVPEPAELKDSTGRAERRGAPADETVERVGVDFGPVPPAGVPVLPEALVPPGLSKIPHVNDLFKNVGPAQPVCPAPQPAQPVGAGAPGDSTRQLAVDAFGQLLQQSGVIKPAGVAGVVALPGPQHLPPPLALPGQPSAPVAAAGAVQNAPPTVWYRDVGGKQCVVRLSPDHLTLTVSEAHEASGKVSTASLVITADYHMARDGRTAVGLITSVDLTFEGEFPPEDSKPFFGILRELQKALEDKPFALTLRSYDDALVIGSVRMPAVSDRLEVQAAGYMAGRYKSAGDKAPKPKVWAPAAPTGGPLPPRSVPAPRVIPSGGAEPCPAPVYEPLKPAPQMPQPIPPAVSLSDGARPALTVPGGPPDRYPGAPTQKPLNESDGPRQIRKERERLCSAARPSGLARERAQGGIN